MENKNIDKLFQEKLMNLETVPNQRVWNNIQAKLPQKKRRIVPFWWYTGGVAALFLLAFFLFPIHNTSTILEQKNTKIIVTDAPKELNTNTTLHKEVLDRLSSEKEELKEKKVVAKKVLPRKKHINTTTKNIEKKKLVSTKNAMEKVFLADNQSNTNVKEISESKKEKVKNSIKSNAEIIITKPKEKKSNSIDFTKAIEKNDSIFTETSKNKKWSIAPVFAVLSSNSFSKKLPVNQNLSNSIQGENSFSYGVQIGYQINSKWTIRSGVHIQETRFTNNNLPLISIASNSFFSSIVFDNNNFSTQQSTNGSTDSELGNTPFANSTALTGDLSQNYGYIEVPVEVKYNFYSTKKFNSEVVGGFSSLFLNTNEVNINTAFQSSSGELNNLNAINFSGNFGFDFNYLFSKNWSLNLNPMFKAQLNTFNENSNSLSPFNIGVYTGLKYQF
ncbi:hypothetical protein DUT90_00625 [Polaribacter sp. WD7]|uniref:hypothetical protein n=1 Tax=Polaribacter sp. WD7 TaxID=2269061 RepID=UPI000DF4BA81|nr:hypothetical protein [Polaribacter sp. WD7]RCS28330.1 hypothetical protein DUT90_00625 [Polaribacter sp. WD7]